MHGSRLVFDNWFLHGSQQCLPVLSIRREPMAELVLNSVQRWYWKQRPLPQTLGLPPGIDDDAYKELQQLFVTA